MQILFLRSVAIVQFYRWYSGEITKSGAFVRCWQILLQKSFSRRYQNFREPLARFSCRDVTDLVASR
jgi:hypothetical protein